MSNARDAETTSSCSGARGKVLLVSRTKEGFSVTVLDKADYERLAAGRPQFTAKTMSAATQKAMHAVESKKHKAIVTVYSRRPSAHLT